MAPSHLEWFTVTWTKAATGMLGVRGLALVVALAAFVIALGQAVGRGILFQAVLVAIAFSLALLVAALVHLARRTDLPAVQKLTWAAIVLFVTPVVPLGALVYFALGPERTRDAFRGLGEASTTR